ncbi:MAG: DUF115 domain-containing protein [Gammaproteobacteria bacterium]|nr:DUF115 domain-containing protein [Gammaproteobacteria bacterium]
MSDIDISQQTDVEGVISNTFGEHYLFGINRHVFQKTDASTVFRTYFGDSLFEEDTFHIIAGTDSGLLYHYIKAHGIPKGSRYLFVELPEILALLEDFEPQLVGGCVELAVTSEKNWLVQAKEMGAKKYAALDRLIPLRSLGVVHSHYHAYLAFWRKFKKTFDNFTWQQANFRDGRRFTLCQIENLTENQIPAICLKNAFNGKTAVVLAGGPSLDELLPWVRKHRENLLVIAVSRISYALLAAHIQPDIIVSIDPHPINLNVCQDMLAFQDGTLLINEFHLTPNLLSSWGGQKVFMGSRYPWPTPLEPENLPPTIGTTVTNTAFALAVEFGVAQIVLGGVDFCFNQRGYTHASGSAEHAMGSMPQFSDQQVETNNGMMADTTNSFAQSANPLDVVAQNAISRGCRTINPAPGAMRLPHVEYTPVNDLQIAPMKKLAREIIVNTVPTSNIKNRNQLYKEVLGEVDRILKELKAIKILSGKALIHNRKLFAKDEQGAGFHNKEKVEHIEEKLNKKHPDTTAFIRRFGIHHFTPILRLDDDRYAEDLEKSCRLYHQAMIDTADELITIFHLARTRTLARLEEEKPQPNLHRLLEQWQHDHHPGRAIQWAEKHKNIIRQLPGEQQYKLCEFQDTFDATLEELGRQYISRIKQGTDLEGTISKAKEYFLTEDKAGLVRMQTSLETHRDKTQAAHFIPLVQGYIAELDGKLKQAINAYQKITVGSAYTEAFMRLFTLHSKIGDTNSALQVLKKLSETDNIYSPMYADLLQATGDIDTAIEIYTDYVLANPDDLNTMMKLGKLYEQCGSIDGVTMTMNYILDKDPDNQMAKTTLASLNKAQANE